MEPESSAGWALTALHFPHFMYLFSRSPLCFASQVQEAPCVLQARACAIKYSKHSHFHSWCNGFLRASVYVCLCAGMCVCSPESIREAQRGTKRPREAQRAYSTYICMWRGPECPSMDRTSLSRSWLADWGAGWLAEAQRASRSTGSPAVR